MQDEFSESVIGRLREAREALGLTLAELADKTGYALTTLSSVENGHDQPSVRLVNRIIDVLQLRKEWVESGDGRMVKVSRAVDSFVIVPESQLPAMRNRARSLRENAAWLNQEAQKIELQIVEIEDYHQKRRDEQAKAKAPVGSKQKKGA